MVGPVEGKAQAAAVRAWVTVADGAVEVPVPYPQVDDCLPEAPGFVDELGDVAP